MSLTQRQSRTMSLVEATTNIIIGYLLAFLTQLATFPLLGLQVSFTDNLLIGAVFTAVSLARSYFLRRFFDRIERGRSGA